MAREKKGFSTVPEQEEMTVVILKFKGGGDTLRKGFDTVSQALAALGPQPPLPGRKLLTSQVDAQRLTDGSQSTVDGESEEVGEEALESENGTSNGSEPRVPGAPRKYWTPEYLTEFNLTPEGKPAWKDYAAEKKPHTDADKYLVASAWLTDCGSQQEFKIAHIFTLFRAMEWKIQKDVSQPLRGLKRKKSYFDSLGDGLWKATNIGLDYARSLPKTSK